ncbi:MAG TPA: histidine kinase [Methylomirabilota bacterium]|jgi:sensor histidine kinase YesM
MIPGGRPLRNLSSHWLEVAVVSLAAAVAMALLSTSLVGSWMFRSTLVYSLIYATAMGALSGVVLPPLVHRLPLTGGGRWLVLVGVILVIAVGATLAAGLAIAALGLSPSTSFWDRFRADLPIVALLGVVVGASMSLHGQLRSRLEAATLEIRTRELEQERTRKLALEARLSSLESRLRPHFLFNTLNAVTALVYEDPARAERTVERLAALLRFSLDAGQRGTVPIADELKIVVDYLEIEKARLGERLSYVVDADPDVDGCAVPPLSVQTVVENSVKHAVAPRRSGGRIRVETRAEGPRAIVSVWDDGPGFTLDAATPGHGLENLQSRLAVRFGANATLTVARRDGGTMVTISLPRLPIEQTLTA